MSDEPTGPLTPADVQEMAARARRLGQEQEVNARLNLARVRGANREMERELDTLLAELEPVKEPVH
jgi:hypothetical protein